MQPDYEFSKSLQDERDYKFTKDYAYDYQENQIVSSIRNFLGRSSSDETVAFIENTRASDINYLSSQITIAENTPAPISAPVNNVGIVSRSVSDFLRGKGSGNFGNIHNVRQLERYQIYKTNLGIYNNALTEWAGIISGYVNNLTNQKSLLESRSFL
jgi:hypothetical protein